MRTLRVAVCGSGNRGRTVWQRHIRSEEGFVLVGVQDVSGESLQQAVTMGNVSPEQCYTDLADMLAGAQPEALLVCPIHAAHAAAIEAGLQAGCHILVEKPFATELTDAVRLTSLAEQRDLVLGVVQNWRTKSVGQALRSAIAGGAIGRVSQIFFRYLRDRESPHLPDYLFVEEDPLLYAMAIHHFDLFRYILSDEVIAVDGHAFNPAWSRYRHPSTVQLWLETAGGVAISYAATFSSHNGHLPLESLQVEGETGTISNESEYAEPPLLLSRRGDPAMIDLTADVSRRDRAAQYELADVAILRNFHAAVTRGEPLVAPARDNLGTLAVIEAAREACRQGRTIRPPTLLSAAGLS